MDIPMPRFAASYAPYELVQVDTGMSLYSTCATASEILYANANLRRAGNSCRFFPAGTFQAPSLHTPLGVVG